MDRQDTQNEVDVIFCISDVPVLEMPREIIFLFFLRYGGFHLAVLRNFVLECLSDGIVKKIVGGFFEEKYSNALPICSPWD